MKIKWCLNIFLNVRSRMNNMYKSPSYLHPQRYSSLFTNSNPNRQGIHLKERYKLLDFNNYQSLRKNCYSSFDVSDSRISAEREDVSSAPVMDMLIGYQKFQLLTLTVRLGIFDMLADAGKAMSVEQLAEDLKLVKDNLERILNACTSVGLLHRQETDNGVLFSNSLTATKYLSRMSPNSYSQLIVFYGAMMKEFFKLEEAVTGHSPHKNLEENFAKFYADKERFHKFLKAMECYAKEAVPLIMDLQLDRFKDIVDLGGCLGLHARTIKEEYKDINVSVADLKPVIEEAMKIEHNKIAGINFVSCNFFEGLSLPKADLYIVSHVLSNWPDDKCQIILENIYNALNDGGAILILDKVLHDNHDGPNITMIHHDLLMMALNNGKDRTKIEFRNLLENQGFKDLTVTKFDRSFMYDAVMANK